jgi:hypothetical protein
MLARFRADAYRDEIARVRAQAGHDTHRVAAAGRTPRRIRQATQP